MTNDPNLQVARLALAEAGVEYRSRSMDIGSGQERVLFLDGGPLISLE